MEEEVAFAAPTSGGFLLQSLPALGDLVAGELDHVEGVHYRHCAGQDLSHGGFVAGEPVHRYGLHVQAELRVSAFQPGFQHLLRPSRDHIQKACWPADFAGGQVDYHGDEPVRPPPNMLPSVLINPNSFDPIKTGGITN